jgi:NAD(P)-dependent dehydrogenase (short-subunit alcohol dehydrogenase family)
LGHPCCELTPATGANQGVGFETAKNLLSFSATYHVIVGSRDINRGKEAVAALESGSILGTVSLLQIDVADDKSVDAAANEVSNTFGRLDILVNNAGILSTNPVTRDQIREVMAVNYVGVVSVTDAFLPLLRKSSAPRLILVSSSTGSLAHASDPNSPLFNPTRGVAYRSSKAALSMVLLYYHGLLSPDGFKVFGADPGLTATNLTGDKESLIKRGAVSGDVGGERIATVVRGDRDSDVGRVCGAYGVMPW